ncbi:MAG: hypothetical protein NTW16_11150 [Bacteroidetes bacterium]|nr:hypothetical protein [Bacteroidota bacterium]
MKKLKTLLFLFMAILMATGCKKDNETPILDATTEEAASIMATSFCTGNSGTLTQAEDAVSISDDMMVKSALYDSSFTITSATGALITYEYQVHYAYGFQNPNFFQMTYDASGQYNSPNVSAGVTADGSLSVTGFLTGDYYSVNGQSGREGTFTMKIGNQNSINGTVTTTFTNFKFSKATWLLESGTATIAVNGSTSAGKSFGFTGTLVYLGNYNASLTISGKTFYINVTTGVVS